jgi:hypothetical protein
MSHHLDSPIALQDLRLDLTDLYAFKGEKGTVLVVNTCSSVTGEVPTPGFHPEGMYEFKIDLDGDAVEDLTYRFTFDERDAAGKQRFVVHRIAGRDAMDPNAAGVMLAEGVTGETVVTPSGLRAWAGEAGDPFWNDLDVIHAVGHAFQDGAAIDLSGWEVGKARNGFAGTTIYSIVLEAPDAELLGGPFHGRRIGVWALATLATDAGGWRPINRIGLPMIHPIFAQFCGELGNRMNTGAPADDFANYGEVVATAIARVVAASGTSEDPHGYGAKVARRVFPNILPYEVGAPASFDFVDWNGRALTDNAPEVMCSLAVNTPVTIGVGKESLPIPPSKVFPYVPPMA